MLQKSSHWREKTLYSQENQMTGFTEILFQSSFVYIFMWSSSANTAKTNQPHLMTTILGGRPPYSWRLRFLAKIAMCMKINQSMSHWWGGRHGWKAGRPLRTPYIPRLISPCGQALSPSGIRLTSSLTAAACLDNPDQEVVEPSTSCIPLGLWGTTIWGKAN